MTSQEILKTDLLDILFENRNKSYGAYALRKFYPARLTAALGVSLAGTVLMLVLVRPEYNRSAFVTAAKDDSGIVLRTHTIPDAVPPPPPPQPPVPQHIAVAQTQFESFRISEDAAATEVAEQHSLMHTAISSVTTQGAAAELPIPLADPVPIPAPVEQKQHIPSWSAPEFPGGLQAWTNFLNRHLKAPASLEPGERKSVAVRFFVGTDGSISGMEVIQSGGIAFDEEVLRVLKKMPRWKPARQNGEPVAITFTQPVTFMGLEE